MKRKLKKSKWSNLSFFKKNILLIMLCLTLLSISSIAYSALNQELNITGDLVLRSIKDIRITSLELVESVNGGYEYYNSKYSNNIVSISSSLPNKGSAITYEATIKNTGTVDMTIASINTSSSNDIATLTVDGISVEDVIPYNNSKTFRITIEKTITSDITELSGLLELTFKEVVPDPNFCLDNGFNKLADCILVMDTKNTNLEETKSEIEARVANFKQIAPYTTYKEKEQLNVVGTSIVSTTSDQIYFSTEKPTLNKETAIYTFSSSNSVLGRIEDYISNETTKYYTCMNTSSTCSNSNVYVIYEYTTPEENNSSYYRVTKADRYTYEIDSVDSASSGIYAISDLNNTTSYYYRGDIENNYVKFGKDNSGNDLYWRIVRINGDGSIRMIYTGTSTTATGYNTGILNRNNSYYTSFNLESDDAAYVGYMYGLDQTYMETSDTSYLTYTNITQTYTYYFSDAVTCSDETKDCTLTGNIISGKWSEVYEQVLNGDESNGNIPYKYTCWKTSSTDLTCGVYSEVKSYVNVIQAKVRYHGYLSKNLDSIRTNTYDSNIKQEIDAWYEKSFVNNSYGKDSHNVSYTDYLADSVFCNDRSIYSGNVNSLQSYVFFWPYRRTANLYKPSLQCGGENGEAMDIRDLFTVSSSNGNGDLTYPVGLLTQDEAYLAGGRVGIINQNYYLTTGSYYWLASPSLLASYDGFSRIWRVDSPGYLSTSRSSTAYGARPVINLRSDVLITSGIGTQTNPYEVIGSH